MFRNTVAALVVAFSATVASAQERDCGTAAEMSAKHKAMGWNMEARRQSPPFMVFLMSTPEGKWPIVSLDMRNGEVCVQEILDHDPRLDVSS